MRPSSRFRLAEGLDGLGLVKPAGAEWNPSEEISARERHVLLLLCDGATNDQIGHGLGISPETVAKHLATLRRKLRVQNRTEVAALALRRDIVDGEPDMRPVTVEAEWGKGDEVMELTPRYLGAEAYRRYPRFRQMLDRPYSIWFPNWRERFGPLIGAIQEASVTGEIVPVEGVRFLTPGTTDEWEWSAELETVNRSHYIFRILTPLP